MGQQLDILTKFGYDEWTNPEDIMENFGCASLIFYSMLLLSME